MNADPLLALVSISAWCFVSVSGWCFALGAFVGGRQRDRYWRSKADGEPMAESNGELFHVVREGDIAKAVRVDRYCRQEQFRREP